MLAISKLNRIESKISEALINNEISYENYYWLLLMKKKKYRELKESISMMSSQEVILKSYCLKYRKDTENINPRVSNTSNGKTMILSKCAICGSKKYRFIKNLEAEGLLTNLGLRTPLNKVPI